MFNDNWQEELRKARCNKILQIQQGGVDIQKAKELPIGTITTHGGVKVKKTGKDKWVPVSENKEGGKEDSKGENGKIKQAKSIINDGGSKADRARKLHDIGMKTAAIAKALDMHYSHAHSTIKKHKDNKGGEKPTSEKKQEEKKQEPEETSLPTPIAKNRESNVKKLETLQKEKASLRESIARLSKSPNKANWEKKELNKKRNRLEKIELSIEKLNYPTQAATSVLRTLGLKASKSSSSAIRGFNRQSKGYKIEGYPGNSIKLIGVSDVEFRAAINALKYQGIKIQSSSSPSFSVNGSVASIEVESFDKYSS